MKRTALQKLIEWGNDMLDKYPHNQLSFQEVIVKAEMLLDKEKKQIIDAIAFGNTFPEYKDDIDEQGEIYYKWTYLKTDSEKLNLKK